MLRHDPSRQQRGMIVVALPLASTLDGELPADAVQDGVSREAATALVEQFE